MAKGFELQQTVRCTICEKTVDSGTIQWDCRKAYCPECIEEGKAYNAQMKAREAALPLVDARLAAIFIFSIIIFLFGGWLPITLEGAYIFKLFFFGKRRSKLHLSVLGISAAILFIKFVLLNMTALKYSSNSCIY